MSAIQAMVTGTLTKDAEAKVSGGGREYTALVVRTTDEPPQFVRAAVWGDDATPAAGLRKGDSVSVVGDLTVGVWEGQSGPTPSLSMMAHRAVSPTLKKPRKAMSGNREKTDRSRPTQSQFKAAAEAQAIRPVATGDGLGDDLPWGNQ